MQARGGLPEALAHCTDYPYFYMGPMMNLELMRKEGTWEKLLKAHAILQQEEQMALTVATEGRVKGVGRKWNLVPHWDNLADGPEGPERSLYGTVGEPAKWVNGLPEGIIHWTGPQKPWHSGTTVWRPDLWESEETSWEALRNGWWVKPIAIEISPPGHEDVTALARRGWKVEVVSDPKTGYHSEALPYPDVHWHAPAKARRWKPDWAAEAEMVRFGPGVSALPWLESAEPLPRHVVLQGPASASDISALKKLGYRRRAEIVRGGWAGGGPAPSVLDYEDFDGRATDLPEGKHLYLQYSATPKTRGRDSRGAPAK